MGCAVSYAPWVGFSGSDTFTYTISDGNGGTASATVSVAIPINVAVVTGMEDNSGFAAIVSQLNNDTYFNFNATLVSSSQVDTIAELNAFDVAVIGNSGSQYGDSFDNSAFTSALRAWVESGHGVVATGWTVYGAGPSSSGPTIANIDAIVPVNTSVSYGSYDGGSTLVPNATAHPVTVGVAAFGMNGGDYVEFSPGGVDGGTTVLATTNGYPTVVVGRPVNGRSVYLGPIYSGGSVFNNTELRSNQPDRLLEQALAWAALPNHAPVANADGPYVADLGGSIVLNGTQSFDPDAVFGDQIVSYQWLVGGTTTLSGVTAALTPTQVNALGIGSFPVQLTVTDAFGARGTANSTLSIYNNQPFAQLMVTPNPSAPTQAIVFDAGASTHGRPVDRGIVSYAWDFGDGVTYTETASSAPDGVFDGKAAHAYDRFGNYTATLTVTDNNVPAKTSTATVAVAVNQGNHAPVANADGPYLADVGGSIVLNGTQSFDPDAVFGDQIVSYAWDLRADDSYEYTSSNPTTTVPWTQLSGLTPGLDYAVRLRVTDTFGATGTSDTTFRIATPTDLAFQPGSCTGTYGETTSLIVKLTTGLVAVPNETVIFRLNGSNVGFATTDAYGIATLTQVSLTGLDAGTYTSYVVASFVGNASRLASTATSDLAISKATAEHSCHRLRGRLRCGGTRSDRRGDGRGRRGPERGLEPRRDVHQRAGRDGQLDLRGRHQLPG